MSKKEISLMRESKLNFKLDIQGTKEVPKVRLNVGLGEMSLSFPGEIKEGVAIVKFPELSFLQEKFPDLESVPAKLEVFLENQYFIPWEEELQIKREIKINAKESIVEESSPILSVKSSDPQVESIPLIKGKIKTSEKLSKVRMSLLKEEDNKNEK